jgi:hypothetical protein
VPDAANERDETASRPASNTLDMEKKLKDEKRAE